MQHRRDRIIQNALQRIEQSTTDELTCPITFERFREPVIAGDGHIYEREGIEKWINQQGTSPLTREPLRVEDIRLDQEITEAIARHYENKPLHTRSPILPRSALWSQARRARRQNGTLPVENTEPRNVSTISQNVAFSNLPRRHIRLAPLRFHPAEVPVDTAPERTVCTSCCARCNCCCRVPSAQCIVIIVSLVCTAVIFVIPFAIVWWPHRTTYTSARQLETCAGTMGNSGGKSCEIINYPSSRGIKRLDTIRAPYHRKEFYLYMYEAKDNLSTVSLQFPSYGEWYFDDLFVVDMSTDTKIIEDGGFEDGTLTNYCSCGSATVINSYVNGSVIMGGHYMCRISGQSEKIIFTRKVNFVDGHHYAISFWLYYRYGEDEFILVYISAASIINSCTMQFFSVAFFLYTFVESYC